MHRFNCSESTIRSNKKNKEALTASVNVFSRFSSSGTFSDTSQRNLLLVITEHYLHKWMERRNREQGDLSEPQIRHQARVYYVAVEQKKHVNSPPPFNASVVLHAWKPLFANSEISGAEQTAARGESQSMAATLMDTVEAARSVPAPGFSDVQVEDLQENVGQHQQQPTIEEMLEEDEEQEQQPIQEDDVKPGEPTTQQLTELLTNIARLSEQLEQHNTRPHPQNP
ncbi:hypothetical protein Hamer_G003713 [Homarus americanus]|uniref:Uncharacterized protein n=1 Tax=Homarus americanus TaxID=6706 RepID=A0A8J5K006_HOMAM|nr:hypothetical protein Hamer_G003713 [Homarus americanus]